MSPVWSIEDVAAAVRSVLRERSASAPKRQPGTSVFPDRLLSLRHVEGLPFGTREMAIAPGTVVTPLARDHLKRLGIELRLVSRSHAEANGHVGEWGFAIDLEFEAGPIAALRRALLDGWPPWQELGSRDVTAEWVAGSEDRGALLLTDESSVAVWRACQVPGVRAASACDAAAVDRAVRSLGVNLLVLEPAGKPIHMLKQMSQVFQKAGAPRVPMGLEWEGRP